MDMNQLKTNIMSKMNLNPAQQQSLNQSIEKAQEMLNSVNNPLEALTKANVDPSFLEKIKGYLNNPLYSLLLPMIGINKKVALQKIEELERMINGESQPLTNSSINSSQSSAPMGQADDLDRFKRGLNSFK